MDLRPRFVLIWLFLVPFCATHAAAQWLPDKAIRSTAGPGLPAFTHHHSDDDTAIQPQNWAITQDERGLVYVGSKLGISVYDGEKWEVALKLGSTVRSLAAGTDGEIFVGLQGDFGIVTVVPTGEVKFRSLAPTSSSSSVFGDVWAVHLVPNRRLVVFQTSSELFLWDYKSITTIPSGDGFHTSFVVGTRFFVRDRGLGLLELNGDTLQLVDGGEQFRETKIYGMLPYDQHSVLIVTGNAEFFLLSNTGIQRLQVGDKKTGFSAYSAVSISKDQIAIATFGDGVIIVDRNGEIVASYGPGNGVEDTVINGLFVDQSSGLWVAANNSGIYRLDIPTPLTKFDSRQGLEGVIYGLATIRGRLLVATGAGLYRTLGSDHAAASVNFESIDGIRQSWAVVDVGGEAIVASENGLYLVPAGERKAKLIHEGAYYSLEVSATKPGTVYAGTRDGLQVLVIESGGFRVSGDWKFEAGETTSIVEFGDKRLLVGSQQKGAILIDHDGGKVVGIHGLAELGLPQARYWVAELFDFPVAASTDAIFKFDVDERYLPTASELIGLPFELSKSKLLTFDASVPDRNWFVFRDSAGVLFENDDRIRSVRTPVVLRDLPSEVARILVEESGVAWISRGDELYRYDPHVVKDYDVPYTALIRKVMDSRTDSVLFGGNFRTANGAIGTKQLLEDVPDFEYEFNNLKFQFAAPTFNSPGKTLYQYRLVGADDTWSEWSRTTTISYSGLSEGSYTFEVRAKNGFGYLSETGSYTFHLLPPWYRTWWAFTAYLFGCVTVVALSWKYVSMLKAQRAAKLQARELARERVINERLNDANEQLHRANLRLTEVNTLKDEFLATTSHELRTPITAILGYASILREEIPEDYHEFVDIIEKSGVRLMSTLNALLDLAELRAGTLQLSIETVDVNEILNSIVDAARVDAADRGLSISAATGDASAVVKTDKSALTKVINVLVGNAIKFTESGSVTVATSPGIDFVCISVSDTGVGIDESFLPVLFDEFRQESDGLSRSHSGNGLGLAIASKLVELLGGSIGVDSQKGVGTTFTITLPLTPVQIVGDSSSSRIEDESTGISGGHRNDRDPVDRHENAPPTNPMRHRTAKTADE